MHILDTVKLTDVEQGIIDYIRDNRHSIVDIAIQDLARETYTSNATIIRLCKKLGYKGFRDFKFDLIRDIESEKYIEKTVNPDLPFGARDNAHEIVRNMTELYRETVNNVNSVLDTDNLRKIAELFLKSKRIFVFGYGDSEATARTFINRLKKIGLFPILATENHEENTVSHIATASDCAIFISYSGYSTTYVDCLKILKSNGCPIITISANKNAAIVKYADHQILIPPEESKDMLASFYSQIAFHYVLNILYSLIYAKDYENNHERTRKANQIRSF